MTYEEPPPTQHERVLAMMMDHWTCGTEFLAAFIPRYSARIKEIRDEPWVFWEVQRRRCGNPAHSHRSIQYEWRLVLKESGDDSTHVPPLQPT